MNTEQTPMPENYVSVPPTPAPCIRDVMNKATQEFIVLSKTFYHELLKPGISDVDLCQALRKNSIGHGVQEMLRLGVMLNFARRSKEDYEEEDLDDELDKLESASGLIMISKGLFWRRAFYLILADLLKQQSLPTQEHLWEEMVALCATMVAQKNITGTEDFSVVVAAATILEHQEKFRLALHEDEKTASVAKALPERLQYIFRVGYCELDSEDARPGSESELVLDNTAASKAVVEIFLKSVKKETKHFDEVLRPWLDKYAGDLSKKVAASYEAVQKYSPVIPDTEPTDTNLQCKLACNVLLAVFYRQAAEFVEAVCRENAATFDDKQKRSMTKIKSEIAADVGKLFRGRYDRRW